MRSKSRLLISLIAAICGLCLPAGANAQKAPVVDTEKTSTNKTISTEELEKLPNSNRDFSKLLDLAPNSGAALVPTVLPSNAPGFVISVRTPPGIHTISFTTPQKDVLEVYLPNQILNAHSFTATMKLIPGPSGSASSQMNDYSLVIDKQKFKVGSNRFDVILPGGGGDNIRLMLVDPKGKEVAAVDVPLRPATLLPPAPDTPTSGTSGNLLVIHGPATGMLPPLAYFRIGGRPMQILTSTAGTVVVLNTYDVPGITEIETNVGKEYQKTKFRNLMLKVSADKYKLLKGESTQLNIVVSGLERLEAPAKMTIDASGVINMSGGNSQTLTIDPAVVKADGTYVTGNVLTALSAGTFGVQVVVSVGKEHF
jgi:hypothetical protein